MKKVLTEGSSRWEVIKLTEGFTGSDSLKFRTNTDTEVIERLIPGDRGVNRAYNCYKYRRGKGHLE